LDAGRTEFGYPRTVCSCRECSEYCHHLPGYLVPADLERLLQEIRTAANVTTRTTVVLSTPYENRPPRIGAPTPTD
jgi:hypothetical protein